MMDQLVKHCFEVLRRLRPQTLIKGRYVLARSGSPIRAIPLVAPQARLRNPLSTGEKIIVVGTGPASLSFCESLRRAGFEGVTLISRERSWGGKCVHVGCMPSEIFWSNPSNSSEARERFKAVLAQLSEGAKSRFEALRYPIVVGEVIAVEGHEAVLADGSKLPFDRLFLGTGSQHPVSSAGRASISMDQFWNLDKGSILITSDQNPVALGYADIAAEKGIKVTVAFEGAPLFQTLPSYQYYQRELMKRGVTILINSRIVRLDQSHAKVYAKGKLHHVAADAFMVASSPEPSLPVIRGRTYSLLDLDYANSRVSKEDDIFLLGDAAGLISTTEAEFHAQELFEALQQGRALNWLNFELIPFRIHGKKPLAFVGSPWTVFAHGWQEVDFAQLGWTAIHSSEGKLWYLFNQTSRKVEAIHICHPFATELIAIARVLIDYSIDDPRWRVASVHPSPAEVFREIVKQQSTQTHARPTPTSIDVATVTENLPPLIEPFLEEFYVRHFGAEHVRRALLSVNPRLYFAYLLAERRLDLKDSAKLLFSTENKNLLVNFG